MIFRLSKAFVEEEACLKRPLTISLPVAAGFDAFLSVLSSLISAALFSGSIGGGRAAAGARAGDNGAA